jgi:hypothetical protein
MNLINNIVKYLIISNLFLFFSVSTYAVSLSRTGTDAERIKFNREYKLKRTSGVVTVYKLSDEGDPVEYTLDEFSSDVVLLVYKNLPLQAIINNLGKKYHLSGSDSRRHVKMSLNTLEQWNIVIRDDT